MKFQNRFKTNQKIEKNNKINQKITIFFDELTINQRIFFRFSLINYK